MTPGGLEILYEDNHLLAVNKPPGLPTMGVQAQQTSLVTLAKQYIKRRYRKPGNVYLGVMSRLDAGTSGVVILARTSKAAARLTEQFRSRQVSKTYWAIVSGQVEEPQGELVDWVAKDEANQRMAIVDESQVGAKEARLRYQVLGKVSGGLLLEIELLTGRKHQIRLQLASRGLPLWGETKYARGKPFDGGIALHARRLVIEHPVSKVPLELTAPVGPAWPDMGAR
jgi:23S rRNA pseudouridine1911/1915/1917 synthase